MTDRKKSFVMREPESSPINDEAEVKIREKFPESWIFEMFQGDELE